MHFSLSHEKWRNEYLNARKSVHNRAMRSVRTGCNGDATVQTVNQCRPIQSGLVLVALALAVTLAVTQRLGADDAVLKQAQPRPNILFLLADDLGYGDLGCYGNEHGVTPNLDRLASQGTRFTQFYVSPVCSPTRAAAITGQFPSRHRIYGHLATLPANQRRGMPDWLDVNAPSLPRMLKTAGYRTAMVGKWHLGGGSGNTFGGAPINSKDAPLVSGYGFDDVRVTYGSGPTWREAKPWPEPHDIYPYDDKPWQRWSSRAIVDEAIVLLDRYASDPQGTPWMMNVWFKDPHTPMDPSPEMRRGFEHLPEPAQTHYAMIAEMDRQIGRLLAKLDAMGLTENTLVIFASDNGAHGSRGGSNGPFRGAKATLFDGGVRVPLIVRWPGRVPEGRVDETSLLHITDFTPTFCRLTGATMPSGYEPDGVDATEAFLGRSFVRGRPIMWYYPGPTLSLAIRDERWTLLMSANGKRLELYDRNNDPGERNNVAAAHGDVVARLRAQLEAYQEAVAPKNSPTE